MSDTIITALASAGGTLLVSIGLTNINANILYTLNPIAAESNIILYQIILFIIGVILFFLSWDIICFFKYFI